MSKEVEDRDLRSNRVLAYVFLFFFSMFATGFISRALNDNGNKYEIRFSGKKQDTVKDDLSYPDNDLADTLSYDNNKIYESQNNVPTVKNFLQAAMEPVGTTLYVYGGGWNEDDSGAGTETLSYGISPRWYDFFKENDADYDFEDTMYQIHDGLDCTGFVGYVVYQVFGKSFSDKGYVYPSKDMVGEYADKFNGTFISKEGIERYYPGDIMGTDGHVFIVIGECSDGSLLFVHASPPVVSLCGTKTPEGNSDSEAVGLAREYMSKYFPESYERYDTCIRDVDFLTDYNQMHWNRNVLTDPDGYDNMAPKEILEDLFSEKKQN